MRAVSLLSLLFCLAVVPTAVTAYSAPETAGAANLPEVAAPEIVAIRVGFEGQYKPGCWTPVRIAFRGLTAGTDYRITLTVPDGDGVPSRVIAPLRHPALGDSHAPKSTGNLPATPEAKHPSPSEEALPGEASALVYTRFGRVESRLTVELLAGSRVVCRKVVQAGEHPGFRRALYSRQELILVIGRSAVGVEEAVGKVRRVPGEKSVVATVEQLGDLPDWWYGLEGIDAVVLATSDEAVYAGLPEQDPRVSALDEWLHNGGRLVLFLGQNAKRVLASESKNPLAGFVSGRLGRMLPLRENHTRALEIFCGSRTRIPLPRDAPQLPYLQDVEGIVEAADGPVPLVIRAPRGFGQVVLVAADLDRSPFSDWEDRGLLLGSLLDQPTTPIDGDETTAVMHYGFNDLAGQLRGALDQFVEVWRIPFWVVMTLIVVYIAAIGPGDYFLLRKGLGRMRATWITFPLIIILFGAVAYGLAVCCKGGRVLLNQADLVDVDVATGRLRGTTWANLFSPKSDAYDLAFRPISLDGRKTESTPALTAWFGLPGNALGGMDPRTLGPAGFQGHYDFSERFDSLDAVPIQVSATKSLTGRWTDQVEPGIAGRLVEYSNMPEGTITNQFSFPLGDCLLAFGAHVCELGTIEPGATVEVGPLSKQRKLKSLLTGRRLVSDEDDKDYHTETTPYDQGSVDPATILRTMMFYEAAGGRTYTRGLSHRYQRFVDGSGLLKAGRAVLVARPVVEPSAPPVGGADLLCNGKRLPRSQARRTTVLRFVLPVEKKEHVAQ